MHDGTWENITEDVEEDDDSAVSEHVQEAAAVLPTFPEPTAVQNVEAAQSTLIEAVQSTLVTSCVTEDVCEASAEEPVLRHEVAAVLTFLNSLQCRTLKQRSLR